MVSLLSVIVIAITAYVYPSLADDHKQPSIRQDAQADYTIYFPLDKYPETGQHIQAAIRRGEPAVCTIDREGAEQNRKESLHGVPTRKGYDRDEWPMAMCREGGEGADIQYVTPSDNRGAGSWISNQLDQLPDGAEVLFVVK
ncbi:NucA/NucB deoxyribonuclease domain-containing protein [Paenibacillus protaetiae]|uniref:DNA-entry nuclease n=1 Tax=Paenibacillus protaetiae TaxID=2509456 RepID=A0A4P6EZV8_9BACL|nr:NucA/NucB deoxyribonuclease domain-containing protein [Paenibacillus protaetiae]QAY68325.1 DNA-entry nuclease [Paenibacillus protaetiae]